MKPHRQMIGIDMNCITADRRGATPSAPPSSVASMSFVDVKADTYWKPVNVASSDPYGQACAIGRERAEEFVRFLVAAPHMAGSNILREIAMSMDLDDKTAARGASVGFFSHVEKLARAGAMTRRSGVGHA